MFILDLPDDLSIDSVLKIIKNDITPDLYPYTFNRVDYSRCFDKWLLEVEHVLNIDMNIETKLIEDYYLQNLLD